MELAAAGFKCLSPGLSKLQTLAGSLSYLSRICELLVQLLHLLVLLYAKSLGKGQGGRTRLSLLL